ncbi:MAG: cupin domain-containing protein [Bacillota bacterium]|jgi:mannose-6-phosphate isomerase-like protein (cupin superfamily)
MESFKKIWEVATKTVPEPNKRNLQVVYTPQLDEGVQNFTYLVSTLYPLNGQTDFHTHPVDEMIIIQSGHGELVIEDKTYVLEPGMVLYAPAGVRHQCKNYAAETMRMHCVYMPALPDESVKKITEGTK